MTKEERAVLIRERKRALGGKGWRSPALTERQLKARCRAAEVPKTKYLNCYFSLGVACADHRVRWIKDVPQHSLPAHPDREKGPSVLGRIAQLFDRARELALPVEVLLDREKAKSYMHAAESVSPRVDGKGQWPSLSARARGPDHAQLEAAP